MNRQALETARRGSIAAPQAPGTAKIVTGPYGTYFLAECSAYAYDDSVALERIFSGLDSPWTFDPAFFFDDKTTSTQAFCVYSVTTAEIVVVLRGSQEWTDWLRDVSLTKLTPYRGQAYTGTGFLDSWATVKQSVQAALDTIMSRFDPLASVDIHYTGHSLGGALATVATLDQVKVAGPGDLHLSTYGAPDVGNTALVDLVYQSGVAIAVFVDPSDPIETWANWYLESYGGYATLAKVFLPAGRGHSILNYIDLVDPYPLRLRRVFLDTPVTDLVVRTYTGSSLGGGTDDKISLAVATSVPSDRVVIPLVGSDKPDPFETGQADTFRIDLAPIRRLTIGDFLLCQMVKSDDSWITGDWDMQGLQIFINGIEIFSNTEINTTLTGANPTYTFIGVDAMSNTFVQNTNQCNIQPGTNSGEPALTVGALAGQTLKVTMSFDARASGSSPGFYYDLGYDKSLVKPVGRAQSGCSQMRSEER